MAENILVTITKNLNAVEKIHARAAGRWPGVLGGGSKKKPYAVGDEYSFTSYSAATGGTEYGTGTVEITAIENGYVTVEILTSTPHEEFVGQNYMLKVEDINEDRIQLYNLEGEPVDLWVSVEKITD